MSTDNKTDDSSRDLFLAAVREVKPLQHDRADLDRQKPDASPRQTISDEQQVMADAMSDEWLDNEIAPEECIEYARSGIQPKLMKRLRRGEIRREAELDLHGLTVDGARRSLNRLLLEARERGWRCLHIIHGKGLRSPGDSPTLKTRLNGWLRQREDVLAFCSAPPRDGGTGAVYVLLKRQN